MKVTAFLTVFLSFLVFNVKSADLIVEEFGIPPTAYPSIGDAITAASNGDRIIIKNRFGNIPWTENLTINKSLTLINGDADTTFLLNGNITLVVDSARIINIIGADVGNNGITFSGNISGIRKMKVSILNSKASIINCNEDIIATISGCVVGNIQIGYGDIIGNVSSRVSYSNATTLLNTFYNDTCYIVGNIINTNLPNASLIYEGGGEVLVMRNNQVQNINTSGYPAVNVQVYEGNHYHEVYNNTFYSSNSTAGFFNLSGTSSPNSLTVMNNSIVTGSTDFDAYGSSSRVYAYYNKITNQGLSGFDQIANNTTAINLVNMGNPAPIFSDIDLTRNDIGHLGGTYPITNWIDTNTNLPYKNAAAQVILVTHPFNIRQGQTINVKGIGYDK